MRLDLNDPWGETWWAYLQTKCTGGAVTVFIFYFPTFSSFCLSYIVHFLASSNLLNFYLLYCCNCSAPSFHVLVRLVFLSFSLVFRISCFLPGKHVTVTRSPTWAEHVAHASWFRSRTLPFRLWCMEWGGTIMFRSHATPLTCHASYVLVTTCGVGVRWGKLCADHKYINE